MKWRYHHTVLGVVVLANFSQLGARLLISPVVPRIIDSFDVSKAAIGLVLTGMWATYALVQFPSGVLGDELGERRVVVTALGLTGLASLLLAFSPSFAAFGAFAIVLGASTGPYFPVATSFLAKRVDATGRAFGLHTAGGAVAGLVAPVAAGYVGIRYGWRSAVLLGAVAVWPVAALFAWKIRAVRPDRRGRSLQERFQPAAIVDLLGTPSVAFTTFIAAITVFAWQSIVSFFPTFLIEHRGFDTGEASLAFGVLFLLSAGGQVAMGALSDTFDRDTIIGICLLVTAVGLALVIAGPTPLVAIVAVGLVGVGISWPGVIQARFMDQFTDAERGSSFGLVRTVYMLLGALGSVVTGALADAVGWPAAYGLVVGLLGVLLAALLFNRLSGADL